VDARRTERRELESSRGLLLKTPAHHDSRIGHLHARTREETDKTSMNASNQSMKPTAPIAKQLQCFCHDTLAWLICFSLGLCRA
jgi:hypothetical protein